MEKCKYLPECKVHNKSLEEESREKTGFWYITLKFLHFYTMGQGRPQEGIQVDEVALPSVGQL